MFTIIDYFQSYLAFADIPSCFPSYPSNVFVPYVPMNYVRTILTQYVTLLHRYLPNYPFTRQWFLIRYLNDLRLLSISMHKYYIQPCCTTTTVFLYCFFFFFCTCICTLYLWPGHNFWKWYPGDKSVSGRLHVSERNK